MSLSSENELDDVVRIARDLIRFDTTNYGNGKSKGEAEAAEYVAEALLKLGLKPVLIDSEHRRTSVVARVVGADQTKPALVVHGHLDVVPADAEDWSVDPFAGHIQEGMLWGRGAVDMKNMNAMILSSLANIHAAGKQPARDLVIAFFADEENGGVLGAHHVVTHHPELFDGASEAISEVGGYSVDVAGNRTYLIQTAEKSLLWIKLIARGDTSHGSLDNSRNAITRLAQAVAALGEWKWPVTLTATTELLLTEVARLSGVEFDPSQPELVTEQLGLSGRFVNATLHTTANPTQLDAGYKHNVVPGHAEAYIDVRTIPGVEDAVLEQIQSIVGNDVDIEITHRDIGLENELSPEIEKQMRESLQRFDSQAQILPYMLSGGTDNKALSRLGIRGYGFAPLQLPSELDFPALFHGVDERVPLAALVFGRDVLEDFLLNY